MKVIRCNYGELGVNSYIVIDETDKHCVIVDPSGNYKDYIEDINELEVKLVAILITHGHFDHISAVDDLKKIYDIPVYTHKVEAECMEDSHKNLSYSFFQRDVIGHADRHVEDKEVIKFYGELNFDCIMVPGHSENSICYYNKENNIVFTGDTLMNMTMGRTDLYSKSSYDLLKNIKERLMTLPEETVVYSGHGENTTIKNEKMYNPMINSRY